MALEPSLPRDLRIPGREEGPGLASPRPGGSCIPGVLALTGRLPQCQWRPRRAGPGDRPGRTAVRASSRVSERPLSGAHSAPLAGSGLTLS